MKEKTGGNHYQYKDISSNLFTVIQNLCHYNGKLHLNNFGYLLFLIQVFIYICFSKHSGQ